MNVYIDPGIIFFAIVIAISDGDTLTLLTFNKEQIKVRLAEIDAPEKTQPFGTKSKESLSEICHGKQAEVQRVTEDRWRRLIAHVKCEGTDAGPEQVRRGMAWVYRAFSDSPKLLQLEAEAMAARKGLWADPNPVPPWQFRRE